MEKAKTLVEKIRGVPFRGPVISALLPEKDLPKLLARKLVEDLPTSFENYAASLVAVGLIEPEPELLKKITRLYARQVAGFYDPGEKKFFIVPERSLEAAAGSPELGIEASSLMQEALLTHELTHALQDQRLDLDRRMKALKDSTDSLLALEAFLEGEATVVMTEALVSRLPLEGRSALEGNGLTEMMSSLAAGGAAIEGSEGVPEFFVKELLFPYVAGTAWIQAKRTHAADASAGRGWVAIEEAYRHLPESTSEILHPGRSFASRVRLSASERPRANELPSRAKSLYGDTFGEWVLRTLLERAGAGEDSATLAADRQDDRILFFEAPGRVKDSIGFLWRIRMSSPALAHRLAESLGPLYTGRALVARPGISVNGSIVEVARGTVTQALVPPAAPIAPAPAVVAPARAPVSSKAF
ncbi:MAG: hypothetical protein ABIT01_16720 [Thermoanaerobaculia bacterium]